LPELNDPVEQRERFEEHKISCKGDDEATEFIDEAFPRALGIMVCPTSGVGMGNGSFDHVFDKK
jgi:lysyl-tRNA synthetase class 2